MCGVFYVDADMLREIESMVNTVDRRISFQMLKKDIHPTETSAVIIKRGGGLCLELQRWGYPGMHNTGVIFNARSESVLEKRIFQNGIRYHRAVIPAKKFYEWNGKKEKNTFSREDGSPLFFAGFCDMWDNERRFVILTTKANASMEKVHERMPLILEKNQLAMWFDNFEQTETILKQRPLLLKRDSEYEQLSFLRMVD